MALTLYHNDMSACAQKVRICLAEKGLEWEDRHLDLRAGEHQQDWYLKLNRRAVVPTLVDDANVVPESNVILEYLEERFPTPRLAPGSPIDRARMRLWTKQLDEGVHDACIAVLSFAIAFRHQYLDRGEQGRLLLEQIPDIAKRERRRDVIDKGLDSIHFRIAVQRMELLLSEMDEAFVEHPWLLDDGYSLADVAFTPYLARLEHLNILRWVDTRPRVLDWFARCKDRPSFQAGIGNWENADYLSLMQRQGAENWPKLAGILDELRQVAR